MSGLRYYTLHKIMAGLLDMKTQAGNDQALEVLVKLAGWVDAWTAAKTEEHMQEILNTEYGGMNEVLYNLAAVTGDDRWAERATASPRRCFFTPLAMRRDELKGLHMNTHVPQVIGATRRYELSSDYRFADVARFFFETVSESRTYATGGSSNNEHWLTSPNHLAIEMHISSHHQECCCSYNMMKLARHLYSWNGDSRLIDYYERNLVNHRLGAIEPETGHTTYFLSLAPGAWKTTCTEDATFWCCTGTGRRRIRQAERHDLRSRRRIAFRQPLLRLYGELERARRAAETDHELSRRASAPNSPLRKLPPKRGRFASAFPRGRLQKTPWRSMASAWKLPELPEAIWR